MSFPDLSRPEELAQRLGIDRVIAPAGSLPQPAQRLDSSGPMRPYEFEVAVDTLCLDATSFRNIRDYAGGDPAVMAARIVEIVGLRGKMHNPETGSGGIALGRVTGVGAEVTHRPSVGDRIATLASLSLTPLHVDEVLHVDPSSAQVQVRGTAYLCDRASWGLMPDDLDQDKALALYDVCAAASHVARIASDCRTVYVLGTGHAGRLSMVAARDAMGPDGLVVGVDVNANSIARVRDLGLCDVAVVADLQDPMATMRAIAEHDVPAADLTVLVVNAPRCESSSILCTRDGGTVLFFSMATNFQAAALTADGMSHDITMLIGSGFAPDRGAYALDLMRRFPALDAGMAAH